MLSIIAALFMAVAPQPTMSDEAQAAILEACEYELPKPTFNMFDAWQEAVLEATGN
jgi:hypothetical protein